MNKKIIIIYIVVIIIILIVVFLSQQAYSRDFFAASLMGAFNFNSKSNTANEAVPASNSADAGAYTVQNIAKSQLINTTITTIAPLNYVAKGLTVVSAIPEKVSESIKSGGAVIKNSASQAAQNISAAEKNIVNYFSGIADSVLHPDENKNNNCPQTPVGQ